MGTGNTRLYDEEAILTLTRDLGGHRGRRRGRPQYEGADGGDAGELGARRTALRRCAKAFAYRRASRPLWSLTSACSVELAVKQLALDEFEEPVHFDL